MLKYLVFLSRLKFLSSNIVLTYLSAYCQYLLYWLELFDLNVNALFFSLMSFGHTMEKLQKKAGSKSSFPPVHLS